MSHVDDGRLHAYLDSALPGGEDERGEVEAHLEVCADCRARLAAAAEDRDSAEKILGVLTPEDDSMPPFEELLARPRTRGGAVRPAPGTAPRLRRLMPLAWAASIAVALVGGWMARGAVSASQERGTVARATSGEDSLAASSEEETTEVVASRGAGGPEETVELEANAAPERNEAPQAPDPNEPQVDEPVAASGEQPQQIAARERAPDLADSVRAGAAREPALTGTDSAGAAADPIPPFPPIGLAERVDVSAEPPALMQEAARSALTRSDDVRLEALVVERGPPAGGMDRSVVDHLMKSERRATAAGAWSEVSPAEAATRLGRRPAEIEGLPWEEMEIAEIDGVVLVRTVHPLPEGVRVVWLLQTNWARTTAAGRERLRRADVVADLPRPPLAAGHVTGSGLLVVLSGLADRTALAGLLERVR